MNPGQLCLKEDGREWGSQSHGSSPRFLFSFPPVPGWLFWGGRKGRSALYPPPLPNSVVFSTLGISAVYLLEWVKLVSRSSKLA